VAPLLLLAPHEHLLRQGCKLPRLLQDQHHSMRHKSSTISLQQYNQPRGLLLSRAIISHSEV
jgi:hypothetical protein